MKTIWRCASRSWDVTERGLIMGVLNVTPDSFSDGGSFFDPEMAIARGLQMAEEGADLIDVGGESTRPGSEPVALEEELRRVLPVVKALAEKGLAVSIDTSKARVARAAIASGACIVNDVSGLQGDPAMASTVAETDCGLVIMHSKGKPKVMQQNPTYDDVVTEVRDYLKGRFQALTEMGIDAERLVFDPGIGFGKTLEHNLALLRAMDQFENSGRPILLGVSRKSFIRRLVPDATAEELDWATVAMTAVLRRSGARIFRVHAVNENRQAMKMMEAMLNWKIKR